MKAAGIVPGTDGLGPVVMPKEMRLTVGIREG